MLKLVKVTPVYFKDQSVIIKDLPDGSKTLTKMVPGAYDGMVVEIYNKENNETEKK